MSKSFYNRIYGVSLEEYCKAHGWSKEELIKHKEIDIKLLDENYKKYASRNKDLSDEELFTAMDIDVYRRHKKETLEKIKNV